MGKSMACLNIIACGKKDGVDLADLEAPENKISSDRRGWSFRKRSARHQVLNNTASTETPSSINKQSPESDVLHFQTKPELSVQEKTSSFQSMEAKTDLPSQPDANSSSDFLKEDNVDKPDVTVDESSVITIQASVRGFLARKLLLKEKNVIKLQAAVRRHLVRAQAIGTLRCVQAIIKIQALVRERRARRASNGNDNDMPVRKETKPNTTYAYVSLEKLLSNTFARQLMESTPKTTSIRIKCEPFKSDSSWKWLERWMSASSVSNEEPVESKPVIEQLDKENLRHPIDENEEHVLIQSDTCDDSKDLTSGKNMSVKESEKGDDLISYEVSRLDFGCVEPKSDPIEIEEKDFTSKVVTESSFTTRKGAETELYMPDLERSSIEQPDETEPKKSFSRKASNPSFIAAQLKFEELSSSAKILTNLSSSGNEAGVGSGSDKVPSSYTDLQVNGSECGTELSISSTLDSPDRSVSVVNDNELKPKSSDEANLCTSKEHGEIEANGNEEHAQSEEVSKNPILPEADASFPDSEKMDKYEIIKSSGVESVDEKSKTDHIESHSEVGSEVSHVACNNITVSESQATPSIQVSLKPKKTGVGKSKSKPSSSSGDKKARLVSRNLDSASSKNSSERNNKTGKRRNSLESNRSDHKEQEPRDSSSSSNSLPSYMQATKSARAKAISNGSPRSSPDVLDKDVHDVRKRHSLPNAAHESQGSPRIQRSLSQAQQNVKGNATQSPQDRKWRR